MNGPSNGHTPRRRAARSIAVATAGVLAAAGLAACSSGSNSKPTQSAGASATTSASPAPKGSGASNSATTSTSGAKSGATSTASGGTSSSPSASAPVGPAGGSVPTGFVPYSSTWVDGSDGWVLGTAPCSHAPCGSVVRTTDGGRSWKGIPAPRATVTTEQQLPAGGVDILRFADRSHGWAAGRGLYATSNGGASWRRLSVGPSSGVVAYLETGGGYVYAVVDSCAPQASSGCAQTATVYAAAVGSDSWRPVSAKLGTRANPGVLAVHGSTWYLGTESGVLHASGTTTAATRANPCPTQSHGAASALLALADSTHLDALCASGGAAGSTAVQLYGSSDAGRHWKKAGGLHRMVPDDLTAMADNGHGVLLISTASGLSYILRSTDDGDSLPRATVTVPTGGYPWADLGFTTSSQVSVTLPGHGLYLSHDTGRTFTRVRI